MTTEERTSAEYYDADTGFLLGQNRQCEGENGLPAFELLRGKVSVLRFVSAKTTKYETSDVSTQF